MRQNRNGHIVFISSPAGFQGLPGGGFYGVTKSALTYLAETLKIEFQKENLRVQVVNPGFVKTPMTDKNPFSTANNAVRSSSSFDVGYVSLSSSGTTVTVKTCTATGCATADKMEATISVD